MAVSLGSKDVQDTRRRPGLRFSLRGLLLFLTLCGLLLGGWRFAVDPWPYTLPLLVLETLVVLVCVELLVRSLPRTLQASIAENAVRLDGTHSPGRARVERHALFRLRGNLLVDLVLILAPANLLLYCVHTYAVPLPIVYDAAATFRLQRDDWKQALRDTGIEKRYDQWSNKSGVAGPAGREARKQMLWKLWPLVAWGGVLWIGLSVLLLRSAYITELQGLAAGVHWRSKQYEFRDLTQDRLV